MGQRNGQTNGRTRATGKPKWLESTLTEAERQEVLDKLLERKTLETKLYKTEQFFTRLILWPVLLIAGLFGLGAWFGCSMLKGSRND